MNNGNVIIGLVGLIGSGKDTVANFLINKHNFYRESYADSLKNAVSSVFQWDRELLEGNTVISRQWREEEDEWWSNRLGFRITPRLVMQQWGTELCRYAFHDDIWIASLEKKLLDQTDKSIVITDVRFPNEIKLIHELNGKVVHIRRGKQPEWWGIAVTANTTTDTILRDNLEQTLIHKKQVHASEWSWVGHKTDYVLNNNSTLEKLEENVDNMLATFQFGFK